MRREGRKGRGVAAPSIPLIAILISRMLLQSTLGFIAAPSVSLMMIPIPPGFVSGFILRVKSPLLPATFAFTLTLPTASVVHTIVRRDRSEVLVQAREHEEAAAD